MCFYRATHTIKEIVHVSCIVSQLVLDRPMKGGPIEIPKKTYSRIPENCVFESDKNQEKQQNDLFER
uniref:Uncharacterized protein n=1 Tax=Rhizophagus irregularis (strain DAOM 181602 / DAOM 197198 / MUCL 43194) TaxID=747089 RepID=U9TGR1_RHIID